jgi:SAM-dependent methyltransferase
MRDAATRVLRATGLMPVANRLSNLLYAVFKRIWTLTGRDAFHAIYSEKYFDIETELTRPTAPAVVDVLMEEFSPSEVLDVGCGSAVYLAEFQRRGVRVSGAEGSENAIRNALIDSALIRQVDLCQPFDAGRRYPFVICFEVAEHLPSQSADTLVASLAGAGDILAFSAAQPGQGGVDHINEQPPSFWLEKFTSHGMIHDEACTQRIRKALADRECVWWLAENLVVLRAAAAQEA